MRWRECSYQPGSGSPSARNELESLPPTHMLVGDETLVAKARIAISLLAAALAVAGLLLRRSWRRPAVGVYVVVTMAVWVTSVIMRW